MPAAGLDYYQILGAARSARRADIQHAFRKAALKWHPERAADLAEAETRFPQVCEAYDVLSHPARRAIFDEYGETGLKRGIPDGSGGFTGGRYVFSATPDEVFAQFFGTLSPFADLLGPLEGGPPPDLYSELTGMTLIKRATKPPPLVIEVPITLGEIFLGATKKVCFTRRVLRPDRTTEEREEAVSLRVIPGWEDGAVVTYPNAGDESLDAEPQDVQLRVATQPGGAWSRDGSTLFYRVELTLAEALTGKVVSVPTFDDRVLSLPVTQIVAPGVTKLVKGEGLPDPATGGKGDLVLTFSTAFPTSLTPVQKSALLNILP